jgi:hypothetical protein
MAQEARAAMIYLPSTDERQRKIADALGDLARAELQESGSATKICVLTWQYIRAPRARLERATYCLGDRLVRCGDMPMPRSRHMSACP